MNHISTYSSMIFGIVVHVTTGRIRIGVCIAIVVLLDIAGPIPINHRQIPSPIPIHAASVYQSLPPGSGCWVLYLCVPVL